MTPDDPPLSPVRSTAAYDGGGADAVVTGHASFVFSCSKRANKMSLHDTNTGDQVIALDAPTQSPSCIAVAADGVKAAYGTATGAVYVWDVMYPSSMESFRPEEDAGSEVTALEWHPRGHVLAVATAAGNLYLWDLVVGALLYPVIAHEGPIASVKWTANGRLLVSVGKEDGVLRVWNPRNVDQLGEISELSELNKDELRWHSSGIRCLDTLDDMSRVAATGGADGTVLLSVLKPESLCGVFHAMPAHASGVPVTAVRFAPLTSPKPLRSASASKDGIIQLFDMDRRLPMGKFDHCKEVVQLEFSENADVLFSAAGDTVRAWDARVAPEEESPVTFGPEANVTSFAITNAGASLVTACDDGKLYSFDMRYPAGEAPSTQVDTK